MDGRRRSDRGGAAVREEELTAMLGTRRHFMLASSGILALLPPAGLAAKGWVDKKPAEWSPSDIQTILNRSAWTREAGLEFTPDAIDAPGGKTGRRATAVEGLSDKRTLTGFKVLVRWESGLPVRLARRTASPANNDTEHYVLSISRVPTAFLAALSPAGQARQDATTGPNTADMARIAQFSSLQRDGKDPIPADRADWSASDFESRIMISFSKGSQPIELPDREVTFVSRIGDLIVRTPFILKEMVYRGKLEL
jgi:hypothetical protein